MTTLWARRIGLTLIPDGTDSVAELEKLPRNVAVQVEVKQPRNLQHHKLFWVLCTRLGNALGLEPENISDVLKIATGYCTIVKTATYGDLKLPKSISFAAMDQTAFKEFFDRCLLTITQEWGIARPDLMEAIKDLLNESRQAANIQDTKAMR